jgi:hypothetical protein
MREGGARGRRRRRKPLLNLFLDPSLISTTYKQFSVVRAKTNNLLLN